MLENQIGHSSLENRQTIRPRANVHPPVMVSVIIPTYNNGRFLAKALDSVLSQSYDAFEIVVVDDGSTDHTQAVLEPYQEHIHYVYQENGGSAMARNHGLALARGEYIVFLDADDILLPNKLAKQVSFLDQKPLLGMVHSGWLIIDEGGSQIGERCPWEKAPTLDLEAWLWKKPIKMGAMMYRRHWLRHVGGFDPELRQSQDTDLMLRLALAGCTAEWMKEPTMAYRQYATSTIRRNAPAQYNYLLRVQEKAFDHPNMPEHLLEKRSRARYFSLRWVAWHIFGTGFPDAVIEPLLDAAEHSPYDAFDTMFDWMAYFGVHLLDAERPLTDLQQVKPYLQQVNPISQTEWQTIERFLPQLLHHHELGERLNAPHTHWWFWKVAIRHENELDVKPEQFYRFWGDAWRPFFDLNTEVEDGWTEDGLPSPEAFAAMGRLCIVQRVEAYRLDALMAFWQLAVARGWVPVSYAQGALSWRLTLFGQQAVRKQWRLATTTLTTGVTQTIRQPSSIGAWFNFVKTAVHYYKTREADDETAA